MDTITTYRLGSVSDRSLARGTIEPAHGETRYAGFARRDYERHGVRPTHCATCGGAVRYVRGAVTHPGGYIHADVQSDSRELDHAAFPGVAEGNEVIPGIERLRPCPQCNP